MIVQCAKCATKFRLDETKIGQRGAKVRCSKCQHSFVVKRPPAPVAPAGFNPDTAPTARVDVEAAKAKALDTATTAPGAGFAVDEPTTDLSAAPGFSTDPSLPALPTAGATDPEIPGLPLPPGPELPDLPGASQDGDWANPRRDPIHEVQTAVYMVPESIRAAALNKQSGGAPEPGLSANDVAAIDLDGDDDDRTGVVSPEVLAQAKAASAAAAAPAIDDIPSAEADLLDDDEVTLVSDPAPPQDPAHGLDALPGDPFATAPVGGGLPPKDPAEGLDAMPGDPFATAPMGGGLPKDPAEGLDAMPGDPFANAPAGGGLPPVDAFAGADVSGEAALGRIQPAVLGGDGEPPAEGAAPASIGLAADLEPEVTKPPPPSPAGAAAEQPAEQRGGWSLGVKLVTTVVGVAILGVGVLLWMGGGRLDLSLIGLGGKAAKGAAKKVVGYKDVHPVAIRSVLYPTRAGKQVLVFVGSAENRSGEARKHVAAVAELRNRKGELVASARAPVGLALNPAFVSNLTDRASLAKAYSNLAADQGEPSLPSRGVVPFTVVLLQPPKGLADLEHTVRLDKGEPVVVPKPEPEPEPEAVEPEEEELDDRKGKRKRKGKRRRSKRKAKATADEEE